VTLLVGLTGNIASGKSTVAAMFAAKGATLIDADELAHEAVGQGTPALEAIRRRWPSVVSGKGELDRAALRHIVFGDDRARAALNAIVHPEVARLRDVRLAEARARGDRIVIYDVPLLFEAGLEDDVDVIVLVDAPEPTRLERLTTRRGLPTRDAQAMIESQMPSSEKRGRAHFIIDNDADMSALAGRVDAVWSALAKGAVSG
jgi:dephospho-CoA kinase